MEKRDPFFVHQIKSFRFAFEGIIYSFQKGTHFKIHTAALVFVTILGFTLQVTGIEWLILILISSAVLAAEAINTAIEETGDVLHPEQHPRIRLAKHCAAGGVLILSIAAITIGLIIFMPKILS